PGLSLTLQPWAEISERLRRTFKLNHYPLFAGCNPTMNRNPVRVRNRLTLSGFSIYFEFDTQGCRLRSNPGLKLANAFGVLSNCTTTVFQTKLLLYFQTALLFKDEKSCSPHGSATADVRRQ